MEVDAVLVEQEDRAQHLGRAALDQANDVTEGVRQRRPCRDPFENRALPLVKLFHPPSRILTIPVAASMVRVRRSLRVVWKTSMRSTDVSASHSRR